jgi:hypothetical protein
MRAAAFRTSSGASAHVATVTLALLVVGCGGSPGPSPETAAAAKEAADNRAMAEAAAAQGGMPSLSGEGSSGVGNATMAATLKGDLLADGDKVKLDGVLSEWPARTRADTAIEGVADASLVFNVAVRYDATNLYVGGEVTTPSFDRTSRFAESEEHASLVLAFRSGAASVAAYDVGFYAGKPGETSGQVRFAGRGAVPGAKIVEAPATGGYTFEAVVPWSAFPEARTVRVGLRAAARYTKKSGGLRILATGPGDTHHPEALPPFPLEAEQSLDDGLLTDRGLKGHAPDFDLIADVAGDAMKERVEVWGNVLTVCGPAYRGGKDYFFRDLGAPVIKLEARSLTGRGKYDLVVVKRVTEGELTRDWFEVMSFLGKDDPDRVFAQEIAVTHGEQHVDTAIHAASGSIDVSVLPAHGWDVSSYHAPFAGDALPVLLPWGPIKSQTYRFDGARFAKVREVTQPEVLGTHLIRPGSIPVDTESARTAQATVASMTPPPTTAAATQLLDQYKHDHGLPPETSPRIEVTADLDGDGKRERVSLMDRDLVVSGPSIGDGHGYAYLTLQPFAAGTDIREVTARDLAGHGAASLVVRGTRHVTPAGESAVVDEDVLFVYALKNGALARVFGIETARGQSGKRVQGLVQFIPARSGHGLDVDVRPGRASGWTRASYPWPEEHAGNGSMEPLLLPWGTTTHLRYAWDGSHFSPAP